MNRTISYKIPKDYADKSIEQFLKGKGYTKQSLVNLKKHDRNLLIDNEWVFLNEKLKENDLLTVNLFEDHVSEKIVPNNLHFEIVYEDLDIMVINKDPYMPIHPSLNNYDNSLGNAIAYYNHVKNQKFPFRCINRLDKNTSGLTIVAKHYLSAGILYNMMTRREIKREYLAIAQGEFENQKGRIDMPIGRVNNSTIERCIDYENGETAITNYEVIKHNDQFSLLKLKLDTGRTHQIRVHLKAVGHPLIGDYLYNPDNNDMQRQALHSYKLSFIHPISEKKLEFIQELPEDMKSIICYCSVSE